MAISYLNHDEEIKTIYFMETKPRLSNLQLELLKIFSFELSEEQLLEIRSVLAQYFANKLTTDIDQLFEEKGWNMDKIEEWSQEHMRINYVQ